MNNNNKTRDNHKHMIISGYNLFFNILHNGHNASTHSFMTYLLQVTYSFSKVTAISNSVSVITLAFLLASL